jgi:hypothetical protein
MYNRFYRTEIEDQDHRKFLDTFMGPNAIAASMMSVIRNYFYTLACRISMDLLIPITRMGTIKTFETLTFDVLRKGTFAEGFLHTRFFRQIFETGLDLCQFSTFWLVTKYKNKYIDPPPEPMPEPEPENEAETTTTPITTTSSTTQEPNTDLSNYYSSNSYFEPTSQTNQEAPTVSEPYNIYNQKEDRLDTFYQQYIRPTALHENTYENSWQGVAGERFQWAV